MRPAFRRGWEGEGKLNRRPGAGQRARSDRHSGAAILLWEREGKALGVPAQSKERRRSASLSRSAAQATAPLPGATQTGDVTASRAKTRMLRHRRSAASRSESAAGARPARREASAPAGQPKDSAPSRSEAGKSATLENPDHLLALLIVTRRAKTTGLVRAAHRAGRPRGSAQCLLDVVGNGI